MESTPKEIRPEYLNNSKRIFSFAMDFNHHLSEQAECDLEAFFKAIECIDRYIDASGSVEEMVGLFDKVINFLKGENVEFSEESGELVGHLLSLKEIIERTDCKNSFLDHVNNIKEIDSVLRITQNTREYIAQTLQEGEEAADLILDVMSSENIDEKFKDFVRLAGETGNLFDSIIDSKADYANNEMVIKPSPKFYVIGLTVLFKKLIKLALIYPKKRKIFPYIKKMFKQYKLRRRVEPTCVA